MPLSDTRVRKLLPSDKPYKLADEKGLFLFVDTNGGKYWRLKYRFNGKEKLLALGVYPDVSLASARDKRDEARKQIANGVDPSLVKKSIKQTSKLASENSFEVIAREWHSKFSARWNEGSGKRIIRRFEKDIFPWIGNCPIAQIHALDLLQVLRRIENRGAVETAHRTRRNCSEVFRYAIITKRAERDPANDLLGALAPTKTQHFASITDPKNIGALLYAINGYHGYFVTKCALQLAPLTFVRPGELRSAEWIEFDLDKNFVWRIPAEKMKMGSPHIVPLSAQALNILRDLYPLTGSGKYVFPSVKSVIRPMSENTVNGALRRLGYTKDEMTGHGFRSMASTLLNEQGWDDDAIERQLAHCERDGVRAAYNYAEYLPERRRMMQHWADYLSDLVEEHKKREAS